MRVLCGGAYDYDSGFLRTSFRVRMVPEGRYWNYGFRIVVVVKRVKTQK